MNAHGGTSERRRAAPLPLAPVPLALVQPAPLEDRDDLLRRAEVVAVVALAPACGGDPRRMVEVVAPEHVEAQPAARGIAEQPGVLRLALADDQHAPIPGRLAHPSGRSAPRMWSGPVSKRACVPSTRKPSRWNSSIQYADVRQDELADRPASGPVEVQGLAPLGLVSPGEELVGVLLEQIAARPQVVVDHVQDHRQPDGVGAIHESAELVRRAVGVERGERQHAVVAPAEGAVELRRRASPPAP